jgi:hypothetical protein
MWWHSKTNCEAKSNSERLMEQRPKKLLEQVQAVIQIEARLAHLD